MASLISCITIGMLAVVAAFVIYYYISRKCGNNTNMTQKSGDGSTNYQAKGDITVNTRE